VESRQNQALQTEYCPVLALKWTELRVNSEIQRLLIVWELKSRPNLHLLKEEAVPALQLVELELKTRQNH
jgi:hypothetical protein